MSVALARKYRVDVTADLTLTGGFVEVKGITDFNDDITPNLEDASTYSTNGWTSNEPTMQDGSLTMTFLRELVSGVLDPGQEMIRARRGQFGDAARIGARWYDKNGGPEANSGIFIPTWKRAQTGVKNLEAATVTMGSTDVPVNLGITNPGVAAAAAVVLSAGPSAVAVGNLVEILGVGFSGTAGAAGVTIGGTNATHYIVASDNLIVAVMPAGSAGSAPIVVTNATTTASNSLAYTRGA